MTCRLCQRESVLSRSHVLPDFFRDHGGSLYPTGKTGAKQPFTQPLHTDPGRRFVRKQHGFWESKQGLVEPLLCGNCEQRFCALENYAKKFFYGKSHPIRLQLPPPSEQFSFVATDYKKMKLFQLSLLWRASEARGEFFNAVTLTDRHRETLRTMLLVDDPGRDFQYPCTMGRMIVDSVTETLLHAHNIGIETGFFAPVSHDHGGWKSYTFMMGGLTWSFCVCDQGVPQILLHSYLAEDGRLCLTTQDGSAFLYQFACKAVASGNLTKQDVDEDAKARRGAP